MRLPAHLSRPLRQRDRLDLSDPSPQRDRWGPWDLALWMLGRWDQSDQEPWKRLLPAQLRPVRRLDPPDRRDPAPWKQHQLDL